ncbi:MAG TPA: lysylphosphatidylglycerol synthase transmembrane domain-containing protein [Longimicrobiales bacterium]|nr:lysylphosphatidylglycerol synthase transmembrane domain-containing protein [Longimicrobiales bacterium]
MSAPARRARLLSWRAVLGIVISVVLLYFAFRGVDGGEVAREVARADPFLFLLAAAAATAVFVIRAWRWKPLLQPLARTGFRNRFAATTIGFMANNLLPARVGEFVRALALTRLESVSLSGSFASLVVERLFDGVVIVGLLVLAMALPDFPGGDAFGGRDLRAYGLTLLAVFLAAVGMLALMVTRPTRAVRTTERVLRAFLPASLHRPLVDALRAFLGGLGVLREPALLGRIALWSVFLWLFNALGFWLAFRAFGIDVGITAALFLQSVVSLAVAVPSAPGFFGVWEYAAREGLALWGVPAAKAVSFAVGFHIAGFIPVTVIGLYYAARLGVSWRDMGASEEVVESAVEAEQPERWAEAERRVGRRRRNGGGGAAETAPSTAEESDARDGPLAPPEGEAPGAGAT